LAKKV